MERVLPEDLPFFKRVSILKTILIQKRFNDALKDQSKYQDEIKTIKELYEKKLVQ